MASDKVPSFKKGDFVLPIILPFRGRTCGYRDMTPDEKQAWYDAPENQGMGDDGESKITSGVISRDLPEGTQMIVLRAACTGRTGWADEGLLCQVKVIETNEVLMVRRRQLKVGQ